MKKRATDMGEKEKIRTLDMLYTAAASIKGRNDMKLFLRDVLTESERIMLGRRIWIARLLLRRYKYDEIAEKLGVGYATVYRVERWLNDQFPGYEKAVAGIEKEMDDRAIRREGKENPCSYAALKRKYPLHFIFFPKPKPKSYYRDRD